MSKDIEALKKAKIVFNAKTSSTEEITDSIYDALVVAGVFEEVFKGGITLKKILMKLFDLAALEPTVNELKNDFPVFLEEFKTLDPKLALSAVNEAKKRLEKHGPLKVTAKWAIKFLANIAGSYEFATSTYAGAQREVEKWKGFFTSEGDLEALLNPSK